MNIRFLQEQLSRIEEIHVIGKSAVVNGVICHVMGVIRDGKQLRLLVLQYDPAFQEQVEEAEERDLSGMEEMPISNRMELRGERTIDMTDPLKAVNKVFIAEKAFKVGGTESSRIDTSDYQSVLILSEFLRQGWQPKGIDIQNLDMLFLTSMKLKGSFTAIPTFDENPTLRFTKRPDFLRGRIEKPISLVVGNQYPNKLWFRDVNTNEEQWVQINRVYLADIWTQMGQVFDDPKMLEHATPEEISNQKKDFKEFLVEICPKGMFFPVVEYECEEEISLDFFTRSYLDAVENSNGKALAIMMGTDQSTGKLGAKLKAAVIEEPFPENTDIIDAELFSYVRITTGEDIVID